MQVWIVRIFAITHVSALTSFVLVGSIAACCSSSTTAPRDAGSSPDAGTDCGYAAVRNEAGCPPTYDTATLPPTCAPVGLSCSYPGAGDGVTAECAYAAGLACVAGQGDAGGRWVAAQ